MKVGPDIATIAALLGDPARANMLTALLGRPGADRRRTGPRGRRHRPDRQLAPGQALGRRPGRGPQAGPAHLLRASGPDVAGVLEALTGLAARTGHTRVRTGPKEPALRRARVCYDHLAGDLGVAMLDSLTHRGMIVGVRRDPGAEPTTARPS